MSIAFISGSPSATSRSALLLAEARRRVIAQGEETHWIAVRDLEPAAILLARADDPSVKAAIDQVVSARAVVISSPIYKASYSGLLKLFLDLLPSSAFEEKPVLPLSTAGSPLHVLALDFTIGPVLAALHAREVVQSVGALDTQVIALPGGGAQLDEQIASRLDDSVRVLLERVHLRAHATRAPTPQWRVEAAVRGHA